MRPKVFCIGFHKTGTTSLKYGLEILGYEVTGPNGYQDPEIAKNVLSMADKLVGEYDAFQDNPWPIIYKEIDNKYPNSKFVLTIREPSSWIRSQVIHFGLNDTPMRYWIYGVGHPEGNEEIYLERYNKHNEEVQSYFKERPNDLLVLRLPEEYIWEKLCPFLEIDEIPNKPFPHANKAADRSKSIIAKQVNTLVRKLEKLARKTKKAAKSSIKWIP